ncbi:MAG: cytochrome c family protein [Planctomycetes bacterium]|nr:cytochrome c family protein [Planctomycetota bacterium]
MTRPISMKRRLLGGFAAIALLSTLGLTLANSGAATGQEKINHYIGAGKCMNCHQADASGNQYAKWQDSKHSHAFEVLGTDEAKRVGKELGIEDPQKSEKCVRCHSTGFGLSEDHFKKGFDAQAGVQCETCHGPGEDHMRARFRAAAMEEERPEGEVAPYMKVPEGEIIVTPAKEVCYGCHNEQSPSFKNFCYYERIDKIRHLDPRKPRTDAEKAALLVCGCGDGCTCKHECAEGCGVPPKKE